VTLRTGRTVPIRPRPAGNQDEIPMRSDMTVYGVHRLPVAW
jgi:hypothetical protein